MLSIHPYCIAVEELASHNHTRGTMNITGSFKVCGPNVGGIDSMSGAFYQLNSNGSIITPSSSTYNSSGNAGFDASRTWTGNTSSEGGNSPHSNISPSYGCYMFKRVS